MNIYQTAKELNKFQWWTKRLKGIKQGRVITLESETFNLELYNKIKALRNG